MVDQEYTGHHSIVLDDTGRIALPKKFKDLMRAKDHITWTLTRGPDANVYLYNREQWEKMAAYLGALHPLDPQALKLLRMVYGCALSVRIDGQGRLAIPQALREVSHLDRNLVLVGMIDHLELWNREAWDEYVDEVEPQLAPLMTELVVEADGNRMEQVPNGSQKGGEDHGDSADGNGRTDDPTS